MNELKHRMGAAARVTGLALTILGLTAAGAVHAQSDSTADKVADTAIETIAVEVFKQCVKKVAPKCVPGVNVASGCKDLYDGATFLNDCMEANGRRVVTEETRWGPFKDAFDKEYEKYANQPSVIQARREAENAPHYGEQAMP